ncbi:MAG TPA: tetratricopeptide repeat protein [Kofleriaceae bacterium]|nr:tetratricopeptide repeat protein [Kofleriaceae bacterium]
MPCPGHNTIAAYMDGAMVADEVSGLEAHLDSCAGCRLHVSSLARSPQSRGVVLNSGDAGAGDDVDVLVPGARVSRFIVLRRIARGGMGEVALGYDPELDRRVALKVLRPELWRAAGSAARERLQREAMTMARLAHPNVVTVFDVGTWGEQVFVAMELVEGATLCEWAASRSPREIAAVCAAAGRGLAAAHAAGIVHRDFKPANVLVGEDGRARVTDFGLALLDGAAESTAGRAVRLVAGTPGYMAPEQLEGHAADERSDQFSFAVAAYEALAGTRPFAGALTEMRAAIAGGELAPPLPGRHVPPRVRRVLATALAESPARRFPSMDALVAALERAAAPRAGRIRLAAAVGVAGAAVAALLWARGAEPTPCAGGDPEVERAWSPARRAQVRASFGAAGAADFDRFAAVIDRRVRDWSAARTEACRATRVRGVQSEALLDARTMCMGETLGQLDALVARLAQRPGDEVLARAVQAADALPRGDDCSAAMVAARGTPRAYPPGPEARRAAEIDAVVSRAEASRTLADLPGERALLDRGEAAARALGDPVRSARVLQRLGVNQRKQDQREPAERSLLESARLAAAAGATDVLIDAALELMDFIGSEQNRTAEASAWELGAELLLARSGDGKRRARIEIYRAMAAYDAGDGAGALAHAERAVALVERAVGPEAPIVAQPLRMLGAIQADLLGKRDLALATYRRALAIVERAYGPAHPDVASVYNLMGRLVADDGELDLALDYFGRALAIRERVFGPDSPTTSSALANLGILLQKKGELGRARATLERSLAIDERVLGPDSYELVAGLNTLGDIARAQRRLGDAEALYRRGARIFEKAYGPRYPNLRAPLDGLGLTLRDLGRCREAIEPLRRARELHLASGDRAAAAASEAAIASCGRAADAPRRRGRRATRAVRPG